MSDTSGSLLEFDLEKRYGSFHLRISATVGPEWLVLLAPSGAGKSVTLNLLSGIVRPDAGTVRLNGETLFDAQRRINRPIRKRRSGYLFQDYALFPHMTVAANIAYGLPRGADREAEVAHWVRFFHLHGREGAYPHQLSGGQRQRVALARTLASRPRLLLLDEPFSALDRRTRERLHREMLRLKEQLALPVILVTHDFVEARLLGDRVAVLEEGRVLEMGDKQRIFAHPQRHQTARFLGVDNVLPATVKGVGTGGRMTVALGNLTLELPVDARFEPGAPAWLGIHGSDVRLVFDGKARPNTLTATVADAQTEGGTNRMLVLPRGMKAPGLQLLIDDYVVSRHEIGLGSEITLWLPPDKMFLCE